MSYFFGTKRGNCAYRRGVLDETVSKYVSRDQKKPKYRVGQIETFLDTKGLFFEIA